MRRIAMSTAVLAVGIWASEALGGIAPPGTTAPSILEEPNGRGDQVLFYYDARDNFTTYVNIRNEGVTPRDVRLDFYGPDLEPPFTVELTGEDQLPAGGTRTIDVGSLKSEGLPAQFGIAFATGVDGAGDSIVTRDLAGNFTVANLLTSSAWGAAGAARFAIEPLDKLLFQQARARPAGVFPVNPIGVLPLPGTVIDGFFVVFQLFSPITSDLALYFNPQDLQPADQGGNQIVLISFEDTGSTPYSASPAPTTWNVLVTSNAGATISAPLLTAIGVEVTNLAAVGGPGVEGQAGSILFTALSDSSPNRLIYFNESLSTFATGYLLPTSETSYEADVQAIYTTSCATTAECHVSGGAAAPNLAQGESWFETVLVPAAQSSKDYVSPSDPESSYLFDKIIGAPDIVGDPMPPDAPLPTAQIEAVRRWILEGANLN